MDVYNFTFNTCLNQCSISKFLRPLRCGWARGHGIFSILLHKFVIYLGESVLSGSSTPATTPSSPNGSRNNSPRGVGRGRGRPRGSRGRGGAPRGSPKQQNGTPRPPRLNAKQCPTPPKMVNAVTNGEDSVEPGTELKDFILSLRKSSVSKI